jgi:hypothetical protein
VGLTAGAGRFRSLVPSLIHVRVSRSATGCRQVLRRPETNTTSAGQSSLILKRKRWATSWRDARDEIGAGLGSARGFAVVRVDGGGVEGAWWGWRAVRRHRFALDRSRPLTS